MQGKEVKRGEIWEGRHVGAARLRAACPGRLTLIPLREEKGGGGHTTEIRAEHPAQTGLINSASTDARPHRKERRTISRALK